jgi:hypothetical protein
MSSIIIFSISGQLVEQLKDDMNITHMLIGKARKESRLVMSLWVHGQFYIQNKATIQVYVARTSAEMWCPVTIWRRSA